MEQIVGYDIVRGIVDTEQLPFVRNDNVVDNQIIVGSIEAFARMTLHTSASSNHNASVVEAIDGIVGNHIMAGGDIVYTTPGLVRITILQTNRSARVGAVNEHIVDDAVMAFAGDANRTVRAGAIFDIAEDICFDHMVLALAKTNIIGIFKPVAANGDTAGFDMEQVAVRVRVLKQIVLDNMAGIKIRVDL